MPANPTVSTITLTTVDGKRLGADIAAVEDSIGSVVLCHPHPLYGGTRHDAVVEAVWQAACLDHAIAKV